MLMTTPTAAIVADSDAHSHRVRATINICFAAIALRYGYDVTIEWIVERDERIFDVGKTRLNTTAGQRVFEGDDNGGTV
ncbi:unnamed protein product [Cuscuta campestris]|uniref:Uncharacterized protein n=1 Tax=Cuscuta campestris TaxID=132261 RepID=A0A484MXB7_9ASTE|nr:unnamed protein product [Cuscuta campestris]